MVCLHELLRCVAYANAFARAKSRGSFTVAVRDGGNGDTHEPEPVTQSDRRSDRESNALPDARG
jgi:hypothetical protein